jgi:hypothetical protein
MKKLMLVAVLFTALFTSCKKESTPTPVVATYPIEGNWTGFYGSGATGAQTNGYSMLVEPGGIITVANGATISGVPASSRAVGTDTLIGNVFKGTYTYPGPYTYSFTATFNNTGKLETGTWGNGTNLTNGGTWSMNRRN